MKKKILIYSGILLLIITNLYFAYAHFFARQGLSGNKYNTVYSLSSLENMSYKKYKIEEIYGVINNIQKNDTEILIDLNFKGNVSLTEKLVLQKSQLPDEILKLNQDKSVYNDNLYVKNELNQDDWKLLIENSEKVMSDYFLNDISTGSIIYLSLTEEFITDKDDIKIKRLIYE